MSAIISRHSPGGATAGRLKIRAGTTLPAMTITMLYYFLTGAERVSGLANRQILPLMSAMMILPSTTAEQAFIGRPVSYFQRSTLFAVIADISDTVPDGGGTGNIGFQVHPESRIMRTLFAGGIFYISNFIFPLNIQTDSIVFLAFSLFGCLLRRFST